ncbi:UDP-3-O-(3-hydroxymyristoyl) glucosamine N-acyltransferase [Flexistipes sinusarabici DSM 4947]|uniref:UDP-3-O-acylglucosamine N-acyltransferase n=1 Tax=Flexistipes sinusarabici (strain ATCC 49648 / DSM 4947 / MAS 10) TaxID=717231 RepID=F8E4M0_FLESM|nr:UDP-3-O-(3-hydroxymyristoyl)glucosamine N-acyltransferase [Flexistipes sinusarabici]AEI15578.1 UDP-3-O-(3-hydroxymyristoyl) glucosamine N-acyltransferase [Flexistipes sinusarabici DSM 4947]
MKLSFIAEKIGARLSGEDAEVGDISDINETADNSLALLTDIQMLEMYDTENVSAFVVPAKLFDKYSNLLNKSAIIVDDYKYALKCIIDIFYPDEQHAGFISESAYVEKDAVIAGDACIGNNVSIGASSKIGRCCKIKSGAVIGNNVSVGDNCTIYPNVTIYDNCIIGNNVIIHAGTVVGSDGFGFVNTKQGHLKIKHIGRVVIEDNVEIGSNCSVDKGTLSSTVIGEGTKIDNLVQVGHNVKIGKHCIIVAQTAIGGSSKIGDFVVLGGQVGISDHVYVADGVMIGSKSGVSSDIDKKGIYSGAPVVDHKLWRRNVTAFKDLYKVVRYMKKKEEEENEH